MNNDRGNSSIVILLLLVVAIIGLSAFAFYTLKNQGALPGYSYTTPSPSPEATNSLNDDLNNIQIELNSATEGSVDQDFKDLESSASSL
ncbi:MAG: hypothetical protein US96_C0016G0003 [Candidatus Woesebacteria bacterium GW2011_GWB1_38_5b]|uniref:Uncharacterized protein n=1 Tax=Candidatus Woesebacteria bacterium GW2011_GWB1_38_5b TaxID=1618569 RepID=A0A0G0MNC1_9BACT|nr:MAG: hypothetical protein US96_C0016G0003 [Candidatus Woesebacteria bacterium GW2011_GWB1_38_5b]